MYCLSIHNSIVQLPQKRYLQLSYQTIFLVVGSKTDIPQIKLSEMLQHNDYLLHNKLRVLTSQSKWFNNTNPSPTLCCRILPSIETSEQCDTFLFAEIDNIHPAQLPQVIRHFSRRATQINDKVLDTCHLNAKWFDFYDNVLIAEETESDEVSIQLNEGESQISGFNYIARYAKDLKQPSRLEITQNTYQFLLSDYGNIELKMPAQSKALYVLFLRHPEGIFFKDISDHIKEFKKIYSILTNRGDTEKIEESVIRLLDRTNYDGLKVALNRCNTMIKNLLPKKYNQSYIIAGRPREKRTILISRELVVLPEKLSRK